MTTTATITPGVRPIPEGYHSLTPTLTVKGAAAAIEFYKRAFGAEELFRAASPDGQMIMHSELLIGDSRVMVNDEFPDMGCHGPSTLGGSPTSLHLYVPDADTIFQQAVEAGATVKMPIQDVFWGDRYGRLTDPFGHEWAVATHIKDLSEEEIRQGAESCMGGS